MGKLFSAAVSAFAMIVAAPALGATTITCTDNSTTVNCTNGSVSGTTVSNDFSLNNAGADFFLYSAGTTTNAGPSFDFKGTSLFLRGAPLFTFFGATPLDLIFTSSTAFTSLSFVSASGTDFNASKISLVDGALHISLANTFFFTDAAARIDLSTTPITAAVPEPATWAMMIMGFGVVGSAVRRASRKQTVLATA